MGLSELKIYIEGIEGVYGTDCYIRVNTDIIEIYESRGQLIDEINIVE